MATLRTLDDIFGALRTPDAKDQVFIDRALEESAVDASMALYILKHYLEPEKLSKVIPTITKLGFVSHEIAIEFNLRTAKEDFSITVERAEIEKAYLTDLQQSLTLCDIHNTLPDFLADRLEWEGDMLEHKEALQHIAEDYTGRPCSVKFFDRWLDIKVVYGHKQAYNIAIQWLGGRPRIKDRSFDDKANKFISWHGLHSME